MPRSLAISLAPSPAHLLWRHWHVEVVLSPEMKRVGMDADVVIEDRASRARMAAQIALNEFYRQFAHLLRPGVSASVSRGTVA